jgi:hypothetical protein
MVARGRVQNGVVVLSDGVRLSEGAEVLILPANESGTSSVAGSNSHSVLDIAPVSLGPLLRPISDDDDLLAEMLEGRR